MALERFSFARDLIAGFRKAFGDNSGFIPAVTLVDSTGADASATLPTGAATSAKQDTIIGHVDGIEALLTTLAALAGDTEYETVAAGQTDQVCGATGAAGDKLVGLLVIPATTSPGGVSIEDGATNIPVFAGGASSVSNLVPFFIPLGIKSTAGGWEITTGADVSVIAAGNFT